MRNKMLEFCNITTATAELKHGSWNMIFQKKNFQLKLKSEIAVVKCLRSESNQSKF